MPAETDIINLVSSFGNELVKDVYLPNLYDVAFERRRKHPIEEMLVRSQENLVSPDAIDVKVDFIKQYGWSWTPMTETGYTPTGAPIDGEQMTATMRAHAATAVITHHNMIKTGGDHSKMGTIIARAFQSLTETFPYYLRALLWTRETGVLGQVVSVSSSVITLDNAGLDHGHADDYAKYFEVDMVVQVLTSAGVKRGNPTRITAKTATTITLENIPAGVVDNDVIVLSDLGGLDSVYNVSSPGLFDVIDDNNTFQGVDRTAAAGEKFKAVIHDNNGTPRAITKDLMLAFLYDLRDPAIGYTGYKMIENYFDAELASSNRYVNQMELKDGHRGIQVGATTLIDDPEAHSDKVIVPDFANMQLADKGAFNDMFGNGWHQIDGRPFLQFNVVYWALLLAQDTRYCGYIGDLTV